ncbi:MAG TPA: HAD family phosphatase [Dehalococcoidia bacterium]|nr:HAD family phosphatase [Dehalococcoidia bacterium]
MIRAAVLDLDGTIMGRDEKVSARVAAAVGRLRELIPVSIATGREANHAVEYAQQLRLTAPQICDGGAAILNPGNKDPVWSAPLEAQLARKIIHSLHDNGTEFIATHPQGSIKTIDGLSDINVIRVSALDMDEESADQVVVQFQTEPELHLVKVYLPYNDLWAVDFTKIGVDKAAGTRRLAQMIGVEVGDMVAAGDSYNDLPLLTACGLAIAMGTAPQELRAVADYVAPSAEEDGLAVAIDEFILPRLISSQRDCG